MQRPSDWQSDGRSHRPHTPRQTQGAQASESSDSPASASSQSSASSQQPQQPQQSQQRAYGFARPYGPGSTLPWERRCYRNRHGRGQRQPMFGLRMPRYRTKSGIFDDLAVSYLRRMKQAWPQLMCNVECAVEDVPPSDPLEWEDRAVPLSRSFPARDGMPARIVLYSMPIQSRAHDRIDLEFLIRDEIVLQLANLNGLHPEDIDPDWGM